VRGLDTRVKAHGLFAGAAGGSIALHTSGCSSATQSAEQEKEIFMKLQRILTISAGAFLFTAAMFGQQVKTDYDRAANFGQYKPFSWEKVQTRILCGSTASRALSMRN
jgi:hypothetical protein